MEFIRFVLITCIVFCFTKPFPVVDHKVLRIKENQVSVRSKPRKLLGYNTPKYLPSFRSTSRYTIKQPFKSTRNEKIT
jgi:hypothetical protein